MDNFVPDALPQPGLTQASLVFETVVEGGLTRLLVLYLEHGAPAIGPIRSARPYFVAWAAGYRALLVHAGGSAAAQRLLYRTPLVSNVEATLPAGGFQRLPAHLPPHDLYGSTAGVRSLAHTNHWDVRPQYPWLLHKRPANAGLRGGQTTVNVDFSTLKVQSPSVYSVSWNYDAQRNVYLRSMGGNPVDDRDSGNQISAGNVVVLFTDIALIPRDRQGRVNVAAVGAGEATYFRDGQAVHGHWVKRSVLAPLRLLDDQSNPVALNPGTTWIEVVPPGAVKTGTG